MRYLNDTDLLVFSQDVEASREDLHAVPFFENTKPPGRDNELEILRRWNSHTPMLYEELGGAYFLRWQGKGVVFDPGCTFVNIFRRAHPSVHVNPHCMDDIDLVIATHDHIDHCEELSTLIILLRAFNKWIERDAERKRQKYQPRKIDLVLSYGVYYKCHTLLEHSDNRALLRTCCKILPMRGISQKRDHTNLGARYNFDLKVLKTRHREIMGDDSGFGLRFNLGDGRSKFVLCDTGDTAYDKSLVEQYQEAYMLLLHVGTLERLPKESTGKGEHLCFHGVVNILNQLKNKPKLVLLGEWGQEFQIPGYRKRFTDFVRKYINIDVPILPADLGMRIRIPDCYVWCSNIGSSGDFVQPNRVAINDVGQRLEYLSM